VESLGSLDAGYPRHVEVDQDDVRSELARHLDGRGGQTRLADHVDTVLAQQLHHPATEEIVVIDDHHSDSITLHRAPHTSSWNQRIPSIERPHQTACLTRRSHA
jgi:hypothetical protein